MVFHLIPSVFLHYSTLHYTTRILLYKSSTPVNTMRIRCSLYTLMRGSETESRCGGESKMNKRKHKKKKKIVKKTIARIAMTSQHMELYSEHRLPCNWGKSMGTNCSSRTRLKPCNFVGWRFGGTCDLHLWGWGNRSQVKVKSTKVMIWNDNGRGVRGLWSNRNRGRRDTTGSGITADTKWTLKMGVTCLAGMCQNTEHCNLINPQQKHVKRNKVFDRSVGEKW